MEVTLANAATSEDSVSASEQISAQAESLRDAVKTLVTVIKGANSNNHALDARGSPGPSHRQHNAKASTFKPNVVDLPKKGSTASAAPLKKAAGASDGSSFPDVNDPRFKDI